MKYGQKPIIQTRFVKTIVILFFSFFILLIAGTYLIELFRMNADVQKHLHQEASNKIEKVELRLSYIIQSLEAFATSSLAINSLIDTSGRTSYLPNAIEDLARMKEVSTIIMFDFSGKPIQSNLAILPEWFSLEKIRPAISIARNNLIFNRPNDTFLIVIPISYYDTPQGGIVAEVKLLDILKQDLDNRRYHYLFSLNGDWQYSNREPEANSISIESRSAPQSLLRPFDFKLRLSQTRSSAMQPVKSTLYEMLFIGVLGIILAVMIAAQVGRKLAQPIITLTERVRNHVYPTAPIGTSDELELLAATFDENTKKLLEAKTELETRVHLRTAQLEEKTQQLQQQHEELANLNLSLEQANKELKYLDKLKDEFISTVSHELRTPLTSIRGTLSLIDAGVLDNDPAKSKELIGIAVQNSERLGNLINDLLDMQKLSAGMMELDLSEISIHQLIDTALQAAQGYAQKYNVQLEHINADSENPIIIADPHRLRQVIDNLVSNAIKYSPANGTVEIYTEQNANVIRICVRDHGQGIPESFKSRVFERFAQVDSTDQRSRSGTGLGLSICRDIITAHKGSIGFNNMPDGGALFWFELQLADNKKQDLLTY